MRRAARAVDAVGKMSLPPLPCRRSGGAGSVPVLWDADKGARRRYYCADAKEKAEVHRLEIQGKLLDILAK